MMCEHLRRALASLNAQTTLATFCKHYRDPCWPNASSHEALIHLIGWCNINNLRDPSIKEACLAIESSRAKHVQQMSERHEKIFTTYKQALEKGDPIILPTPLDISEEGFVLRYLILSPMPVQLARATTLYWNEKIRSSFQGIKIGLGEIHGIEDDIALMNEVILGLFSPAMKLLSLKKEQWGIIGAALLRYGCLIHVDASGALRYEPWWDVARRFSRKNLITKVIWKCFKKHLRIHQRGKLMHKVQLISNLEEAPLNQKDVLKRNSSSVEGLSEPQSLRSSMQFVDIHSGSNAQFEAPPILLPVENPNLETFQAVHPDRQPVVYSGQESLREDILQETFSNLQRFRLKLPKEYWDKIKEICKNTEKDKPRQDTQYFAAVAHGLLGPAADKMPRAEKWKKITDTLERFFIRDPHPLLRALLESAFFFNLCLNYFTAFHYALPNNWQAPFLDTLLQMSSEERTELLFKLEQLPKVAQQHKEGVPETITFWVALMKKEMLPAYNSTWLFLHHLQTVFTPKAPEAVPVNPLYVKVPPEKRIETVELIHRYLGLPLTTEMAMDLLSTDVLNVGAATHISQLSKQWQGDIAECYTLFLPNDLSILSTSLKKKSFVYLQANKPTAPPCRKALAEILNQGSFLEIPTGPLTLFSNLLEPNQSPHQPPFIYPVGEQKDIGYFFTGCWMPYQVQDEEFWIYEDALILLMEDFALHQERHPLRVTTKYFKDHPNFLELFVLLLNNLCQEGYGEIRVDADIRPGDSTQKKIGKLLDHLETRDCMSAIEAYCTTEKLWDEVYELIDFIERVKVKRRAHRILAGLHHLDIATSDMHPLREGHLVAIDNHKGISLLPRGHTQFGKKACCVLWEDHEEDVKQIMQLGQKPEPQFHNCSMTILYKDQIAELKVRINRLDGGANNVDWILLEAKAKLPTQEIVVAEERIGISKKHDLKTIKQWVFLLLSKVKTRFYYNQSLQG